MARDPRVDEGLRRLGAVLRAAEAPVVEHLRPGRPAGEVAARLEDAGLTVTPDILSWFAWHDGCSSIRSYGPDRGFLYDHPFPGLDEVLDRRAGEEGRFLLEHEREMRGWRAEDVLPFLSAPNGTVGYAVRDGDRQQVWLGLLEDGNYVAHGTLADFVELLASAWEQQVIRYDEDANELVHDVEALERLRVGDRPAIQARKKTDRPPRSQRPSSLDWDDILLTWRHRVDPTVGVGGLEMPAGWPARQGASNEQLAALEERLGRRLPPSYRSFLARTDGVDAEFDRTVRHARADPGFDGFLATDRVDVVGVADPGVLLDRMPSAGDVPLTPASPSLATWCLRGAGTRFRPLLAHLPHCVVACASRGTAVYLDPLTVDADGEWEAWTWDEERFARYRSFGELVQHKLARPHATTPLVRPDEPDRQTIWDLARRAQYGESAEARQALHRLLDIVDEQPSTRRFWALDELGRSPSPEVAREFAARLPRHLDDLQVVGILGERTGAWTRQPGARDFVVQALLRHTTYGSAYGLWWPAALEEAYIASGHPDLLGSLVFFKRPGAAGEARRRIGAGIDATSRERLERTLTHADQYPAECDLAGSLRDAATPGGSAQVGEVPSDPARRQALELLEGTFVLREGRPGSRKTLRAGSEVVAAATDLVRDAVLRRPSRDLLRLAGLLGDVATLSALSDDADLSHEIDLALEIAAIAPTSRGEAIDTLGRRAAAGRGRAADALARLGDVRSLAAPRATPVEEVRRFAYLADPVRLGALHLVLRDPDADDDTAVTAALGIVRTAFRTPSPLPMVTDAWQGLSLREDAAIQKLRTHWRRLSAQLQEPR